MIKIGIECHVQLNTKSKIFCNCSTKTAEEPNINTCEVCLGQSGSKPRLNFEALKQAIKVALALNCKIAKETFFSRKVYFYPDLPKNFQITQHELPLASEGSFNNIRIRRVHMEEDPGKLIHEPNFCLIDYNRSGIPLIEIVTEPDFKSQEEVRDFLNKLVTTLEYLGVYFRESESSLRTDANISLNNGERVEIKNITGAKDTETALRYEIERQKKEKAVRETRGWDAEQQITYSLRKKETEEDYGYITEPSLTKIEIDKELIEKIKKEIPELAHEKIQKFIKQYKLEKVDAEIIASDLLMAELFEKVAKQINPILAAKWIRRELLRVLNYNKKQLRETEIKERHLVDLLNLIENKKITERTGQRIIEKLVEKPFDVKEYIEKEGLIAVSDKNELTKYCEEAIKENAKAVGDYKKGEEKALNFVVGAVMKKSKGKATPKEVNEILKKLIK
ncbi:MAG: Asp-tRNA(Asn)/Glu-tRNA(Gln) amidotransferase subunit GatB [Nanoarchaeota archaeon]